MARRRNASIFGCIIIATLLVTGLELGVLPGPGTARAAAHAGAPNFTLTDQFGRRFTLADHAAQPVVLFFGYSHCGDVCPLTFAKLERAKTTLGASARSLQVVFVTVDPRRDTPPVLRRFIGTFDPAFLALTGSEKQLAGVYAAYHVTRRVLSPSGRSRDYDVEHSSYLYFIGRGGRLRGFGDWADSQQIVTQSVSELVSPRRVGQQSPEGAAVGLSGGAQR
jgi:protein SCO1/2